MKVSPSYRENLIREWRESYKVANNKTAPAVTIDRGWFLIGTKRYGRAKLEEMRNNLRLRAHARAVSAVVATNTVHDARGGVS